MEHRVFIRGDERGAIEGLPLQLMIAVIVAGVALAIILGWVLSIPAPKAISRVETTPETVSIPDVPIGDAATATVTITIRAFDQKGNPLPGIVAILQGTGVSEAQVRTDGADGATDGAATFLNLEVQIPAHSLTARIDVTVQASGFPSRTEDILIVRE